MDSDPAFLYNITIYNEFLQIFVLKAEDLMINVRSLTIQNLRYLYIISVCLSVCLSDNNSGTLGPIYLKFEWGAKQNHGNVF